MVEFSKGMGSCCKVSFPVASKHAPSQDQVRIHLTCPDFGKSPWQTDSFFFFSPVSRHTGPAVARVALQLVLVPSFTQGRWIEWSVAPVGRRKFQWCLGHGGNAGQLFVCQCLELDCYWVGSLDFNFVVETIVFSTKPSKK